MELAMATVGEGAVVAETLTTVRLYRDYLEAVRSATR
jgi:hypothetical protein